MAESRLRADLGSALGAVWQDNSRNISIANYVFGNGLVPCGLGTSGNCTSVAVRCLTKSDSCRLNIDRHARASQSALFMENYVSNRCVFCAGAAGTGGPDRLPHDKVASQESGAAPFERDQAGNQMVGPENDRIPKLATARRQRASAELLIVRQCAIPKNGTTSQEYWRPAAAFPPAGLPADSLLKRNYQLPY